MREAVITGIGAVSHHGHGAAALWRAAGAAATHLPGRPADPLARMDLPLIYLVPDGGADEDGTGAGRAERFALAAAEEAVAQAGLTDSAALHRAAVIVGSCMGEVSRRERGRAGAHGPLDPVFPLAARIADRFAATGASTSIANACAAGGFALSIAADLIRLGEADVAIAGGSDGYSRIALGCFNRLGAVDPVRCRPFDRDRRGTVFGEGAGILVLESAEHAAARGATVLARLAGVGWSCDAHHPTAPEPSGAMVRRTMREALAGSGGPPGCVIPHGTGTRLNDVVESRALNAVVGPGVPLYSLKALIGHTGGAATALAACAAVLMLRDGAVPPNVPLDVQDPECPVLLPHKEPEPLAAPRILVNGYAFGGNNVSLLLEGTAA